MARMHPVARAVALLAALALPPALAQRPAADATSAPAAGAQKAAVTKVARVTAKVEALDRTARTIKLRGSKGATSFFAGPEVRGFDQIRAGDYVVVRYLEPVLVDIRKGGSGTPQRVEAGPEGTARRVTVAADVVAKDAAKRTVTLRGPQQTREVKAASGEQLKQIQVGDRVEATYTEAVAISIDLALSRPDETKK